MGKRERAPCEDRAQIPNTLQDKSVWLMPLQSRSANEQKRYDIFIAVSYHQRDSEKQRDLDGCK